MKTNKLLDYQLINPIFDLKVSLKKQILIA